MARLAVLGVPSSAGARLRGQELAPKVFRELGLVGGLRSSGVAVQDFGDLPVTTCARDRRNPKCQNLDRVVEIARQVSSVVEEAARARSLPIILGGDCTVTIGAVAGMLKCADSLGLVYFDGDLDLNTPETTPSGILDGMVMAHVLGLVSNKLSRIGARFPLVNQNDVVFFGYNPSGGGIDPVELPLLSRMLCMNYPASVITENAVASARSALDLICRSITKIFVHFDVDVIDSLENPATDVPHRHGLSYTEAMDALGVFVSSPAFAGMAITELNVHRDQNRVFARRLANSICRIIDGAHAKWEDPLAERYSDNRSSPTTSKFRSR